MSLREQLDEHGCAVVADVLDTASVERLAAAADVVLASVGSRPAGIRNLVHIAPEFAGLETDTRILTLVEPVLGRGAFITRSLLFDKRPEANWDVVWHQDKAIVVRERRDVPGFGPWSTKSGVAHVQPPEEVLQGMVTVRLHLDDCGPENGPLHVIRGSHRRLLPDREVDAGALEHHPEKAALCVARGGAVVMRPLILHSSKKASAASRRRVVHLEFAARELPGGLAWARC